MLIEVRRRLHEERVQARQRLLRGWKLAGIERSLQDAGRRVEYWRVR